MLHYTRMGQGSPLLLLHATLSSSRQLRALATRLAATHTVVSVDRRGSGRSTIDGLAQPVPVSAHLEDLVEILDHEGLGAAAVVGHSLGGCIALEMAVHQPQLVRSVLAYEPPYALVAPPAIRDELAEVGRRTLAARDAGGLGAAALTFMESVSGADAVAALPPAARARVEDAGQGAVADATLSGMDPHGLRRITCPVRIVTGGASAPFYAVIAEALVERIPGAGHLRLPGLDHMAPVLLPETLAAAVGDFLA